MSCAYLVPLRGGDVHSGEIGIEAHKHFAEVAILEPGRSVRNRRIRTTPAELKAFVEELGPTVFGQPLAPSIRM